MTLPKYIVVSPAAAAAMTDALLSLGYLPEWIPLSQVRTTILKAHGRRRS